jgi:Flp pilus assembly protein TadG
MERGGWTEESGRGSNLVEFALTLPVLLWLLFGIFDLGRAVFAQNVISNAAREGARYAITNPQDVDGIVQRVEATAVGLDLENLTVQVEYPTATSVRVTVTYTFSAVTPLIGNLLGGPSTLHAASTMNVEDTG